MKSGFRNRDRSIAGKTIPPSAPQINRTTVVCRKVFVSKSADCFDVETFPSRTWKRNLVSHANFESEIKISAAIAQLDPPVFKIVSKETLAERPSKMVLPKNFFPLR